MSPIPYRARTANGGTNGGTASKRKASGVDPEAYFVRRRVVGAERFERSTS